MLTATAHPYYASGDSSQLLVTLNLQLESTRFMLEAWLTPADTSVYAAGFEWCEACCLSIL